MTSSQVNIVVDVRQRLGRGSGDALAGEIGGLRGVSRAWVSPRTPRLVLVDYDPVQTDTGTILRAVARRGFDARLVGM